MTTASLRPRWSRPPIPSSSTAAICASLYFSDKYLSGGKATANGETVSGKFTLDEDQKIYGHSLTASTLLQAGPLQLKVIFTPDNRKRFTKAECTVDVNVIPANSSVQYQVHSR